MRWGLTRWGLMRCGLVGDDEVGEVWVDVRSSSGEESASEVGVMTERVRLTRLGG